MEEEFLLSPLVLEDDPPVTAEAAATAAVGLKQDTPWFKWLVPKDDQNPLGFKGDAIFAAQLL